MGEVAVADVAQPVKVQSRLRPSLSGRVKLLAREPLLGLGVACWPGSAADWPLRGMLTYSSLATLYLVVPGFRRKWVGKLLWPAVAVHAILTILLAWVWSKERKRPATSQA